ncbi:MAG: hypothetical protein DRG80_07640 [Deltaproteobacteria bacterium]|nr:MAG: hypothetical protein DRG80_07640 [Deltaproteobacteria bacterium]
MTHDEALALYNAGPKFVVKMLCDLSNTIESQQKQIKALARLSLFKKNMPIFNRLWLQALQTSFKFCLGQVFLYR